MKHHWLDSHFLDLAFSSVWCFLITQNSGHLLPVVPFQPHWTLQFISAFTPLSVCNILPKYLNSSTQSTCFASISILPVTAPLMHTYSVFDLDTLILLFPMLLSTVPDVLPALLFLLHTVPHHQQTPSALGLPVCTPLSVSP